MNLQTTLSIFAGGAGSGCNPAAGKCGRPERNWKTDQQAVVRLPHKQVTKDVNDGYQVRVKVHVNQIRTRENTGMDKKVVAKYAQKMKEGARFPVPTGELSQNGKSIKLFDGHHRLAAWKSLGKKYIPVDVSG